MHSATVLLLAILAAAALLPSPASSQATLLSIAFVHRHGARAEPLVTSHGIESNQAELTLAGRTMARNMGTMLRARYQNLLTPFPSAWDPTFITSQSTEIGRTIQTAVGVLRGLWPDPDPASLLNASLRTIPFIDHTLLAKDFMLTPPVNWPNTVMRTVYFSNVYNNTVAAQVLNTTALRDALDVAATPITDQFGSSWCNDNLMTCGLIIQDMLQCRYSNTGLDPSLFPLEDALLWLQAKYNQYYYPFDRNSPNGGVGSYGYPLVSTWLGQANAALGQFAASPTTFASSGATRIHHYSAHDNTVMAVWATLGVANLSATSVEFWVPRFAQTVIMETWSNGTVAFVNALPNETFGSDYAFSTSPLTVRCVNAQTQAVYYASACPVADFSAALAQVAPAPGPSGGMCFLTPSDRQSCDAIIGPLPTDVNDPSYLTGALCASYRKLCPAVACPTGTVLNRPAGTCVVVSALPQHANFLNFAVRGADAIGIAAGIAVGSLLVPLLLVAAIQTACRGNNKTGPSPAKHQHGLNTSFLKDDELQSKKEPSSVAKNGELHLPATLPVEGA